MRRIMRNQVTTIQIISIEFLWADEATCEESTANETIPTPSVGPLIREKGTTKLEGDPDERQIKRKG